MSLPASHSTSCIPRAEDECTTSSVQAVHDEMDSFLLAVCKVHFRCRNGLNDVACRSVKMEGEVMFNGEKLTKKIKKRVGYVLQGSPSLSGS